MCIRDRHTGLDGREGHASYAPCSVEDLLRCGYDYWALGHIHRREVVHLDPPIVFAGNLQGRHVHECGAKGAYVVTVTEGRPSLTFHPLDVVRWERLELSIDGLESIDNLLLELRRQVEATAGNAEGRIVAARVELIGSGPLHQQLAGDPQRSADELRAAALDAGLGAVWLEKVVLRTRSSLRSGTPRKFDADAESPIEEIDRVVAEILESPVRLAEFRSLFDDLRSKVPNELQTDDRQLPWSSDAALRELLQETVPLLHQRLSTPESSS